MLLALILMNIIKRLAAYSVFGNIYKLRIICVVVFVFITFMLSLIHVEIKIQKYYKDLKNPLT